MRRTTSLTALLLGATLLAPTGAAHAAGETCRGEAATIVGTERVLQGTEERDVIVTGASTGVLAGAGDDLICVTGSNASSNVVDIDAGPGNDLVDSTTMARYFYLDAVLGDGADTFVGGPESETVVAGATGEPYLGAPGESEIDLIDTGAGGDSVTSGGPGLPNPDVVRTGAGDDNVIYAGVMGAGSVLDAGDGDDLLLPRASGTTFDIDLAARTLGRDSVPEAVFTAFERLSVSPEPGLGAIEIVGSDDRDVVDIRAAAVVRADLGAGIDSLTLSSTPAGTDLDLGAGTDVISVRSFVGSVDLDLTDETLSVDGSSDARLVGVENAYASADEVTMVGGAGVNHLNAVGCFATIDGRGGNDQISHGNYDFDADAGYDCTSGRVVLRGGPANDTIDGGKRADRIYGGSGRDRISTGPAVEGINKAWGGPGADKLDGGSANDMLRGGGGRDTLVGDKRADTLVGGAGRDRSVGGPGRDTCRTEVRTSCER